MGKISSISTQLKNYVYNNALAPGSFKHHSLVAKEHITLYGTRNKIIRIMSLPSTASCEVGDCPLRAIQNRSLSSAISSSTP